MVTHKKQRTHFFRLGPIGSVHSLIPVPFFILLNTPKLRLIKQVEASDREGRAMNVESIRLLIKLQVFIDSGLDERRECKSRAPEIKQEALARLHVKGACIKSWFLRMAIDNTPEYLRISAALRQTEAYSMVSFLLREGGQGEKLNMLSARYGVSTCHFRRLFRSGLGSSPKSELKGWQLAKAVLAVIEDRRSITDAAMAHGYASSSHFSNEVRKSVGFSLTQLFDANARIGDKNKELM